MPLLRSSSVPYHIGSASPSSTSSLPGSDPELAGASAQRARPLQRHHSTDALDPAITAAYLKSLPSSGSRSDDDPFSLSGFFPSRIGLARASEREKEWEWIRAHDEADDKVERFEEYLYEVEPLSTVDDDEWHVAASQAKKISSMAGAIKVEDKWGDAMTYTSSDDRYAGLDEDELHGGRCTMGGDGPRDKVDRYAVNVQTLFFSREVKVVQPPGIWETMVCKIFDVLLP